jgi:hypothetical protein
LDKRNNFTASTASISAYGLESNASIHTDAFFQQRNGLLQTPQFVGRGWWEWCAKCSSQKTKNLSKDVFGKTLFQSFVFNCTV